MLCVLEHTLGKLSSTLSDPTLSVMVAVGRDAALPWVSQWDTVNCQFDKGTAVREQV